MKKNDLTAEQLSDFLTYNPESGTFVWKLSRYRGLIGQQAGTIRNNGYRIITLLGYQYLAHRLAWLAIYGEWPRADVDHRDGRRDNNAQSNLRDVTKAQNRQNQRVGHRRSASGLLGVSWSESHKKWRASIMVDGKSRYLGRFKDKTVAHVAYVTAKAKLHPFQTMVAPSISV